MEQELRQEDELAPTLFNLALEYVIRKMSINSTNVLTSKSTQIAAYADDVNIMDRSMVVTKEVYVDLENRAREVGLKISIDKTKVSRQRSEN